MAGYKEIKGFQVQTRSEDPVPFAQAIADNPYVGAWSSGGNLNTAKNGTTGAGTQTAAFVAGGNIAPGPTAQHEQYNGSSWTETTDLNAARNRIANSGTTTSGLAYGGTPPNTGASEYWNGSSWTELNDLNTARQLIGPIGKAYNAVVAAAG